VSILPLVNRRKEANPQYFPHILAWGGMQLHTEEIYTVSIQSNHEQPLSEVLAALLQDLPALLTTEPDTDEQE